MQKLVIQYCQSPNDSFIIITVIIFSITIIVSKHGKLNLLHVFNGLLLYLSSGLAGNPIPESEKYGNHYKEYQVSKNISHSIHVIVAKCIKKILICALSARLE